MPSRPPPPRPRIVVLTPHFPQPQADNAGMHYVELLREALEPRAELVYLAPDFPSNKVSPPTSSSLDTRVVRTRYERTFGRLHALLARVDPGRPYLPFAAALLRRDIRAVLRTADVVDMQWEEFARLARLVRKLAPGAKLIGTYHDVLSQRYQRMARAATTRRSWIRWTVAAWFARRHERRSSQALDTAIFFSDKDRQLVPAQAVTGVVVGPPVAGDEGRSATVLDDTGLVVVFVAYLARPENVDAATWLLSTIWPLVLSQRPLAQLRIAGGGAPEELKDLARTTRGAELIGFVDDLTDEYRKARACIVPLRHGAGVKFKVIDAMSYGVPVVSTSVGAEGIGDKDWFAAVADDPRRLADAVIQCLDTPMQELADLTRARAQSEFGYARFVETARALYRPRSME